MICKAHFRLKKDGTANSVCFCRHPELIENHEAAVADNTQTWQCHHRLETHTSDGERRLVDLSSAELIALDVYYDRPPEELIFLTKADHARLHSTGNEERGRKVSKTMKKHLVSEEQRRKVSEKMKGHLVSEETKQKISEANKGKHNKSPSPLKGKHWKLVDGKRDYC